MLIYKATITTNNKQYIGLIYKEGKTLEDRIKQHYKCSLKIKRLKQNNKKIRRSYRFQQAILKYGIENVKWQILQDNINSKEYLCQRQKFNIIKYDTYISNQSTIKGGYNMTLGGEGSLGLKCSQQKKQLLRQKNLGKKASQQAKLKMRQSHKKRLEENPMSEQICQKISIGRKNWWQKNPQQKIKMGQRWRGRIVSQYRIQQIKKANTGKKQTWQCKLKKKIKADIYYSKKQNRDKTSKISQKYWNQHPQKRQQFKQMFTGQKNPFYGKKHSVQTINRIKETKAKRKQIKLLLKNLRSIVHNLESKNNNI